MSIRILRNSLATLATAAALALGGHANAAFYSSSFDPPGPLTFSGTGLFQLDDACLAFADGIYNAALCNLTLLSATIDMMDTVSLDTGHLNFAGVLPDTANMIDLVISGGELVAVDTQLIGSAFPAPCTGTLCGDPWWIQWGSNFNDPVFLYTGNCDGDCFPNQQASAVAENVTFTRVPEPGTMSLLVAALGFGWFFRRRNLG
jgi:hypothetical protein